MKDHLSSFLSRLALPGLMLLIMTAGTLSADTFAISVNLFGFMGTGSFNTDGTCDPCVAGSELTNFTFTVDDDTFDEAAAVMGGLVYIRSGDTLLSAPLALAGGDNAGDFLLFDNPNVAGKTIIGFADADDPPNSIYALGTITPVPEPSSLVLLAGGIGWLVFGLTRRFGKKSAIH
jgi:hypothetical protein